MATHQLKNGRWINADRDPRDGTLDKFYARAHKLGTNIHEVFGPLETVGGLTRQYTSEAHALAGGPCVCCPLERRVFAARRAQAVYDTEYA